MTDDEFNEVIDDATDKYGTGWDALVHVVTAINADIEDVKRVRS